MFAISPFNESIHVLKTNPIQTSGARDSSSIYLQDSQSVRPKHHPRGPQSVA